MACDTPLAEVRPQQARVPAVAQHSDGLWAERAGPGPAGAVTAAGSGIGSDSTRTRALGYCPSLAFALESSQGSSGLNRRPSEYHADLNLHRENEAAFVEKLQESIAKGSSWERVTELIQLENSRESYATQSSPVLFKVGREEADFRP